MCNDDMVPAGHLEIRKCLRTPRDFSAKAVRIPAQALAEIMDCAEFMQAPRHTQGFALPWQLLGLKWLVAYHLVRKPREFSGITSHFAEGVNSLVVRGRIRWAWGRYQSTNR